MVILSHIQAREALDARKDGRATAEVSLDLNRTYCTLPINELGLTLPMGARLYWSTIQEIEAADNVCFVIEGDADSTTIRKAQLYSEERRRFYSLYPTAKAPTMLLSGIPMHRIKGVDPIEDTSRKLRAIAPISGDVLDICTGLGYTAIAAARTAAKVITIEMDPTVLSLCKWNPWSQELFDNCRIEQRVGDAATVIESMPSSGFTSIFHDPPTFSIAGDLYSGQFYAQLYRVLKRRGRLFHYIGDLDSKSGRIVARGAVQRLRDAGFVRVDRRPEAFGLVAARD